MGVPGSCYSNVSSATTSAHNPANMRFGRNVLTLHVSELLSQSRPHVTMQSMDGSESAKVASTPHRITGRRLGAIAAIWAVLVAGAVGIASALDSTPVPPPAQSIAPQGLPLLFTYLDRALPAKVVAQPDLPTQITTLEQMATTSDDPARWVELGVVAQRVGDLGAAKAAFDRARARDPKRLDARVGLIMNDGATGPDGLKRASTALATLEADNRSSQLLAFNRGIVAVYRSDRQAISTLFERARALDPETELGRLATTFATAQAGAAPTP
jgi:cytochrome c-type biogenesis protein CcmH/NrfG